MLPDGVRRLIRDFAVKPGNRAVVLAADERELEVADELREAGRRGAAGRRPADGAARPHRGEGAQGPRPQSVVLDGTRSSATSSSRPRAASRRTRCSRRRAHGSSTRRRAGSSSRPTLPDGVEAVGIGHGRGLLDGRTLSGRRTGKGQDKCFVCVCEDVTTKDVERAVAEGFDSIELSKRYTTVTMGPCQGKLCQLPSIRLYARTTGVAEEAVGTTTARPPWAPVELGLLAGPHYEPARRTSIHFRHEEAGREIMWTGPWKRPYSYGEQPEEEVRAVHESLGVIDVSTLGKLLVEGPEAAALLERLYPNRFADLRPGRIRYGVLTTDGGRIMDDGTIARLADDLFYVTTTSTGADAVTAWFEWWNAVWGYEAEIVNVTGALAALNLAGPRAREALARLVDDAEDVAEDAFRYLDAKELDVAGVPCLALRIGFVGELGYELHFPSPAGEFVWDRLVAEGARPFGLEPQRVLRLEKGHIIVGQDTDSESNLLSAGHVLAPEARQGRLRRQARGRALRRAGRARAARRLRDGGRRRPGRGRAGRHRGPARAAA